VALIAKDAGGFRVVYFLTPHVQARGEYSRVLIFFQPQLVLWVDELDDFNGERLAVATPRVLPSAGEVSQRKVNVDFFWNSEICAKQI
jgi:hypothetical protein